MKFVRIAVCLLPFALAACGTDETTVIHEKPVVIQQPAPVVIQR